MKCTALVNMLVVGLVLGSSVVGCKKKGQNLTTLLGRGQQPIADDGSRQAIITPPNPPPQTPIFNEPLPRPIDVRPGGGDQTDVPRDAWTQDRVIFQEQTVYFDFDRHAIKAGEVPKLQTVVSKFKALPGVKALRIEGHCDERGTEEYNRSLGERRALAVREKLASLGLEAKDIETISFGEDKPVDPGHDEAAWSKNRRGEIILLTPPGAR